MCQQRPGRRSRAAGKGNDLVSDWIAAIKHDAHLYGQGLIRNLHRPRGFASSGVSRISGRASNSSLGPSSRLADMHRGSAAEVRKGKIRAAIAAISCGDQGKKRLIARNRKSLTVGSKRPLRAPVGTDHKNLSSEFFLRSGWRGKRCGGDRTKSGCAKRNPHAAHQPLFVRCHVSNVPAFGQACPLSVARRITWRP